MKKPLFSAVALVVATSFTGLAMAAGPELTELTDAIDFDTTKTAILAIAGLLAAVFVAIRAAKTVLSMIKGG